jgi:hypothetical protein
MLEGRISRSLKDSWKRVLSVKTSQLVFTLKTPFYGPDALASGPTATREL